MSERTTIGGTVYEAIGSSSSNLLLKCNGTARIQWGGKLIDLIKNGKIASEDSKELIFIINNESEINADGIYVLTTEESEQLWICKAGNKYNFTSKDLYVSTSNTQDLTVEQKIQALNNIGLYYNTLEEVQKAEIQNGIVYVIDTQTLYTIKNGIIEDFTAKLKNITVQSNNKEGNQINDSVKIVLSISDEDYLILSDKRIISNYSIHVKNSAQIGSELADKTQGYRLYIEGNTSYLDVDKINVRNGIDMDQCNNLSKFIFHRGMIIMHSGIVPIPEGWAICDGGEYEFEGVKSTTPNLINRFIKAVATVEEIASIDNSDINEKGEITLKEENLPSHSHPHNEHSHSISSISGTTNESGILSVSGTGYKYSHTMEAVQSVSAEGIDISTTKDDSGEYYRTDTFTYTGGNHTHNINIAGINTQSAVSIESNKTWDNKPIKIEPNYYALIFIMKL